MNIYVFLIIWVVVFGVLANITAKPVLVGEDRYEYRANMFMAIMTFSFLIIMIGLRSGMADTFAYIDYFNNMQASNIQELYNTLTKGESIYTTDKGFYLLLGLIKCFVADDFHVWLFVLAVINGLCIAIILKRYSSDFMTSALLFILTVQFSWMYNGLRQFFVAGIMFLATDLLLKRKMIPYILLVLLMSNFHTTAVIFIPIYFIVDGEAWNKRTIAFMVFVLLVIIFASRFTSIFNEVVDQTQYANGMEELAKVDDGTNIIRVLVECVPVIMAFIFRNKIEEISTPIINLSINMSAMSAGIYVLSVILSSGLMIGRLPIYFSMYNLILLPWMIQNLFDKNEKRLIYYIMLVCYFIFFYYQMFIIWEGASYISDIFKLSFIK